MRAFSGGERYLVSDGGTEPAWAANGQELFYRRGPSLIVASIRDGPGFTVLGRTELFSDPLMRSIRPTPTTTSLRTVGTSSWSGMLAMRMLSP